jgi:KTSC domain-containing protein
MRLLNVTDSDNIEAIGFDPKDKDKLQGTLAVVFKQPNGKPSDEVYLYEGVRYEVFVELISAESVGKAFYPLFRKTKYPFTKSARPSLKK